ncbi:hypothetical protein [Nocardia cyriacigeorgica]|uniref:hypothetical protein n=1 Tax=Nocardia cyriacigeorgica TaxID=135487 RepID=UPI0024579821|nr:hypothetical protein [Nocardia cyriacigeorgica]
MTTNTETQQNFAPPAVFDTEHVKENLRWGHLFWPGATALTEAQIDDRVVRYQESLRRYRASGMTENYLPEDLEVDSVWHAHQCDPVGYAEFCNQYFGGLLAHNVKLCVCKLVDLDQQ